MAETKRGGDNLVVDAGIFASSAIIYKVQFDLMHLLITETNPHLVNQIYDTLNKIKMLEIGSLLTFGVMGIALLTGLHNYSKFKEQDNKS